MTRDKLTGLVSIELTPSRCPSRDPTKGLANTLSNFVAFKALTYSLDPEKGCNDGS